MHDAWHQDVFFDVLTSVFDIIFCQTLKWATTWQNQQSVRPAKTQISLGICPVWSESSLCAQWVAKDPKFLHADSEDSDQTGRMPRLIWVFPGRTLILLVLSCRGSNVNIIDRSQTQHFWIFQHKIDNKYSNWDEIVYTLSHLSAHVVNRLLCENWKTIPKYLSGKKLFKNVTLQILNFNPVS